MNTVDSKVLEYLSILALAAPKYDGNPGVRKSPSKRKKKLAGKTIKKSKITTELADLCGLPRND